MTWIISKLKPFYFAQNMPHENVWRFSFLAWMSHPSSILPTPHRLSPQSGSTQNHCPFKLFLLCLPLPHFTSLSPMELVSHTWAPPYPLAFIHTPAHPHVFSISILFYSESLSLCFSFPLSPPQSYSCPSIKYFRPKNSELRLWRGVLVLLLPQYRFHPRLQSGSESGGPDEPGQGCQHL